MLQFKNRCGNIRPRSSRHFASDWIGNPRPGYLERRDLAAPIVFYRENAFKPLFASVFSMQPGGGTGFDQKLGDPSANAGVVTTLITPGFTLQDATNVYNRIIDPGPTAPPSGAGAYSIEAIVTHQAIELATPNDGTGTDIISSYRSVANSGIPRDPASADPNLGVQTLAWGIHDIGLPGAPLTATNVHVDFGASFSAGNPLWHGTGGLQLRSNLINVDINVGFQTLDYRIENVVNGTVLQGSGSSVAVQFNVPSSDVTLAYTSDLTEIGSDGKPDHLTYNDTFTWHVGFTV